ncbi:MAG: hypothetical protein SV775_20050, partial [Thermodesulfobacteriota bacterium]|nr:hypothetical protein [Thermodesulfobacteriota bacterium]
RDFILSYFGEKTSTAMRVYRDFVRSVMGGHCDNPLAGPSHPVILGSEEFVAEIKEKFLQARQPERDLPALRGLSTRPGLDRIEKVVDSVLQSDEKLARQIKLHFCHRFSGMKLVEIGQRFGVGESGVVQASRRLAIKVGKNKELREIIKTIETRMYLSNV